MKKLFPIFILGLSLSSLAGCNSSEPDPIKPVDENAIASISFSGTMTKRTYNWDDEWDISGLSVKAKTNGGKISILPEDKYTINFSKKAPKNYTSSLQVTAKLKDNLLKTCSATYKDIVVNDEVYDDASEMEAYYSDCNLRLTGSSLMNELHRHSFAKHTYFVIYQETTSFLNKTNTKIVADAPDLIPGKHKTQMLYTGNEVSYEVGTREHVWACADSGRLWDHQTIDSGDYIGGGSDLYHIRPCDSKVNTARGDAPYVCFDDSDFKSKKSSVVEVGDGGPYKLKIYGASYYNGNYEYADLVEPADEFKGDIARIVAYLYMHYNTNSKTPSNYKSMTGSLDLTKVIGYSTLTKAKNVLKKWNELDPVNDIEKHRNHTVGQIQGNRNPFVDYPDLIDKVF